MSSLVLTWIMNHTDQEKALAIRKNGPKMGFSWLLEVEPFFSIFSAYVQCMLGSLIPIVCPW